MIQVFTGNGRGKTTAALGSVLRALGQGLNVYIAHFMKGTHVYGEQKALAQLPNVTIEQFGTAGFVDPRNVKEEDKAEAQRAFNSARDAITGGKYDLVVMDEANVAVAWGLIAVDDLVNLAKERPENVEIIITGRYADPRLMTVADLVTEMVEVKHPYQQGIKAREGFEY